MPDNGKFTAFRHWVSHNRIYLLWAAVFALMAALAPNFLTIANQASILKGVSHNALAAIGFTIVMISRQLDLSIGTTLTLGGMMTIGLQPHLGWTGAAGVALLCGLGVGLLNGFLVAVARVDSFIATLGTMIVTRGLVLMYCGGGSLSVSDFTLGAWTETPFWWIFSPGVLVAFGLVLLFEFFLKMTPTGRGFYLVGGNPSAAWHAGLSVKRHVIGAFLLSGALAALAGALLSVTQGSARTNMGDKSLMLVIAAVIIGGTSMAGGKGSVLKSLIALIALNTLSNGFNCMGADINMQKITNGVVLGSLILYDAIQTALRNRTLGQRPELLEELAREERDEENQGYCSPTHPEDSLETTAQRSPLTMHRKDNTLIAIVSLACVACVAIVAIFAMYFLKTKQGSLPTPSANMTAPQPAQLTPDAKAEAPTPENQPDLSVTLRSTDGQPLILPAETKTIPERPADPLTLPEDEAGHWWDMEYSGWNVEKVKMPSSPGDGPRGKKVLHLKFVDHPYTNAMSRGMKKVADAYGIEVKTLLAENDANIQGQQVDQAINEKPDLVIINPVDAQSCVPMFKKLNEAGIPVIASNLLPAQEAQQYILAWTGPDDWGQFRSLAQDFAKRMNYEGGYAIVRHYEGGSPYFSRTYSVITELKKIAPKMKLLEMQTTDLKAEKTREVVSGWLIKYGPELKGIVSADDSAAQMGLNKAVTEAGREDIIRVAAGNSKVGMDALLEGALHAITFQSAEADGALPMQLAVDWFSGRPIPPIRYLPIRIITRDNVKEYMPAQW